MISLRTLRSTLPQARRLAVLVPLVAVAACNLDNSNTPPPPSGAVIFVNAAPRYSSVDLQIDSALYFSGQVYPTGGASYVSVYPTSVPFVASIHNDTTTLATGTSTVGNDTTYTVILTQHTTKGGLLILPDTVSVPTTGTAKVRLINVAPSLPGTGAVDVYVTAPSVTDLTNVTPLATNVPFEGTSGYLPVSSGLVSPGTYTMYVTQTGTKTPLLTVSAQTISAGQATSYLILDAVGGGTPFQTLSIQDR